VPLGGIVDAVDGHAARLVEVVQAVWARQRERRVGERRVGGATGEELVEDMEAALARALAREARLLKQVGRDTRARDTPLPVKKQPDELAKAGRVVVVGGGGVTECFEDDVRVEDLARPAVRGSKP
jgi:hypothetical protein